ncbi:MAG: TIGR02710 family CRISPR-associated CARF protein [bacterium]|nr:TIGR02710 family CRISPR-associated CARF protein [bacterium]
MSKILIITVGGSIQPIVSFIKTHGEDTDYIYFICSTGTPKKSSSPLVDTCNESIIKQSSYKGLYEKVEIADPDSFEEVYQKTKDTIDKAKSKGKDIIADFTGGTKTMSSVLCMLATLDFYVTPSLTTGPREDLEKVKGISHPSLIPVDLPRAEHISKMADLFIKRYFYYSASLLLREFLSNIAVNSEIHRKIDAKCYLCEAFNYWDRFEYEKAYDVFKNYCMKFPEHWEILLKLTEKDKNTGYEKVFDLYCNAERQAYNGYYDNAVARIYRAIEMFVQIRLKRQYDIDTSHLEKSVEKLKNKERWEQKRKENGEIPIGLTDAYELLMELQDPIGEVYKNFKNELLNVLSVRNKSKLAHGDEPVSEKDWIEIENFFKKFIMDECCKSIKIQPIFIQLPQLIEV